MCQLLSELKRETSMSLSLLGNTTVMLSVAECPVPSANDDTGSCETMPP
jgi:hypothetical protein